MRQLKRNTGQATVEYLLLIVVIIALALSIGKPLGDYLQGLSGAMLGPDESYYACLMEEAKLPGSAVSCGNYVDLVLDQEIKLPSITPGGEGDGSGGGGDSGGGDSNRDDSRDRDSDSDRDTDGRDGSRRGGKDSARDRKSFPKKYRVDSEDSLSGGADSSLTRERYPSEFLASLPSSSNVDGDDEDDEGSSGSIIRRGRGRKNKSFGSKFDNSGQKGYKQNRFKDNSEFSVGYLGETFVEEKKQENRKVFKSDAVASFSSGSGIKGEDQKSVNDDNNLNGGSPANVKVKKINLLQLIRYIVLAILIILVLAFVFSQTMEYQSRD